MLIDKLYHIEKNHMVSDKLILFNKFGKDNNIL